MGAPSERTITKSWMSDHSTFTSPRMRSVKLLTPSSGVRKRIVRGRPFGSLGRPFVGGERATATVVAGRAPGGDRGVVALLHLVFGAVALVGVALREQTGGGVEVEVEARALEVRPLVPVEAQPAQRVLDPDDPLLTRAGDVGVLDAQHEDAFARQPRWRA